MRSPSGELQPADEGSDHGGRPDRRGADLVDLGRLDAAVGGDQCELRVEQTARDHLTAGRHRVHREPGMALGLREATHGLVKPGTSPQGVPPHQRVAGACGEDIEGIDLLSGRSGLATLQEAIDAPDVPQQRVAGPLPDASQLQHPGTQPKQLVGPTETHDDHLASVDGSDDRPAVLGPFREIAEPARSPLPPRRAAPGARA